jgi:hypothetical protein
MVYVALGLGMVESRNPWSKLKVRTLPGLVQFGSTCDRRKLYVDGTRSAIARRLWLQQWKPSEAKDQNTPPCRKKKNQSAIQE